MKLEPPSQTAPACVTAFVNRYNELFDRVREVLAEKQGTPKSHPVTHRFLNGEMGLTVDSIAKVETELDEKLIQRI